MDADGSWRSVDDQRAGLADLLDWPMPAAAPIGDTVMALTRRMDA